MAATVAPPLQCHPSLAAVQEEGGREKNPSGAAGEGERKRKEREEGRRRRREVFARDPARSSEGFVGKPLFPINFCRPFMCDLSPIVRLFSCCVDRLNLSIR